MSIEDAECIESSDIQQLDFSIVNPVRVFLSYSVMELYTEMKEMGEDTIMVEFEDGVILECRTKEIVYSRVFWKLHERYYKMPLTSKHFFRQACPNGDLSTSTHRTLLTIITRDIIDYYNITKPKHLEPIRKLIYEITNEVAVKCARMAEEDVVSVDLMDFINIVTHPRVKQINNSIEHNNESIVTGNKEVMDFVKKDKDFDNNNLAIAVRTGMVRTNQTSQCISRRGFVSEVDGHILPSPVDSNFTEGLYLFHDYIGEGRSAARSLYFAEAPLEDAEFFSRRGNLLAGVIERIIYEDCGSEEYVQWHVKPPRKDEHGNLLYQGDLPNLVGQYRLDDETKELVEIKEDDSYLVNKIIRMRNVIKCKHLDKQAVCEFCFGKLSRNLSRFTNTGHVSSGSTTKESAQLVLSNKHYQASSVSAPITLNEMAANFFTVDKTKMNYMLLPSYCKSDTDTKITIYKESASGLVDLMKLDSIEGINPGRITDIEAIEISYDKKRKNISSIHTEQVILQNVNRNAIATREFLSYIHEHGWKLDQRGNFVIDMTGWNPKVAVFRMPEMEYSYADHSKMIAKLIESNMDQLVDRQKPGSPESTLQELFDLVNSKLSVNIAPLSVFILACMVNAPGEYDMPRNSKRATLGVSKDIIKRRSLGGAFAFQGQEEAMTSASSYFVNGRPDSVFDVFLKPKEVVEHYRKLGLDRTIYTT